MNTTIYVISTLSGILWMLLIRKTECAPSERQPRQSPFSRMTGGGGSGPFHSPMGSPMGGNHMPPSIGGPSMRGQSQGQAGDMMHPSGSSCVRGNVVCPQWCLVEDSQGCKTCPCGPGGGMTAVGGPSSSRMGGSMGGPMAMAAAHMGGGAGSILGGATVGGGGVTASGHHQASSSGTVSYTSTYNTGTSSHILTPQPQTQVTTKPVKECAATLLCATTCKGYSLGGTSSGGCKSCSCPSSHHVSSTTVNYIVQTVQPPKKECTVTSHCMRTCPNGYVMSKTDSYGCPECVCLIVEKPYKYPVEIAIEPPEYTKPVYSSHVQTTYSLTCRPHSCNSGCTVGYKCGTDGCPTCECVHPTVVGLSSMTQVYVQKPLTCQTTLACPSSCSLGYKCGIDGCPTCDCLYATSSYTQVRPQYTAQTCTHTLTCATTCAHGYELFTDGTSSCYKCACKQQPVVYAVQRPKPQYQIVQCPGTTSCATECPQGYTIIQTEGSCPKCKCKQASVHYAVLTSGPDCTSNCHQTSYYTSSGSHNPGGISYIVDSNSLVGAGTSYVIDGSGSTISGSYVTAGGGVASDSYRTSGATGHGTISGVEYCPPLPPDCQPSCIKYDDPHCRKCICNTTYVRYTHG